MSSVYVNLHNILVVKIGRGEVLFKLNDPEDRKRAYDFASANQMQFPDLAHDMFVILLNSEVLFVQPV